MNLDSGFLVLQVLDSQHDDWQYHHLYRILPVPSREKYGLRVQYVSYVYNTPTTIAFFRGVSDCHQTLPGLSAAGPHLVDGMPGLCQCGMSCRVLTPYTPCGGEV